VFRRLFRVTFKLGMIAAIGFGIAVVVRKLTAPADNAPPIEPWPPLTPEGVGETGQASVASANGDVSDSETSAPTG